MRASQLFNEDQRRLIEQAVQEAESQTSCEIVPVVASSSGRYDRPEDIVGLWMAVIAAVAVWLAFPAAPTDSGSWDGIPIYMGLLTMVLSVVLAFMAGAFIASRVDWLRRLFTPRQQMLDEVRARAREVFYDRRVHHTAGGTGMLIYISLFERKAAVLADEEVLKKLDASSITDLCALLIAGLHQGQPTETICKVISVAGHQLSPHFPRAENDVNELEDTLVLID